MKSLESLNFMLGLIKEEPGDLWLKMTDEGLVLHVQICSGRAVPYRAFSIILITQITQIYFSSKTFVLIMCSSCFFRHDMNYTLALNPDILGTIVCSFLQTLFDHTGHIYIPHTTWRQGWAMFSFLNDAMFSNSYRCDCQPMFLTKHRPRCFGRCLKKSKTSCSRCILAMFSKRLIKFRKKSQFFQM